MKTANASILTCVVLAANLLGAVPEADAALLNSTGKVTLLRVHDVGTKFGPPADQLDAEVIVNLDSSDKAFGFQLRRDTNAAAHMGMLDDLREAFDRDRRVRLEWVRVGPRTGRITRVIRLN